MVDQEQWSGNGVELLRYVAQMPLLCLCGEKIGRADEKPKVWFPLPSQAANRHLRHRAKEFHTIAAPELLPLGS